jgi:glutaminase
MNVLKNLRSDGTLSPSVKDSLIKLNQSVAQSMRRMAEQDSLAQVLRDKEVVKADLTKVCSH